jgi:hypothetical protein
MVTVVLSVAGAMVARRLFPNAAGEIPWMAAAFWLTLAVVVYLCTREMWSRAAGALFLGLIDLFAIVHQFSMPRLDRQGPDTEMLRRLHARMTAYDQVVSTGGDPRRQWFYLERDVRRGAEAIALSATPGVYVISSINAPSVLPSTVKRERVDQGTAIAVDRILP